MECLIVILALVTALINVAVALLKLYESVKKDE